MKMDKENAMQKHMQVDFLLRWQLKIHKNNSTKANANEKTNATAIANANEADNKHDQKKGKIWNCRCKWTYNRKWKCKRNVNGDENAIKIEMWTEGNWNLD